MTKDEYVGVRPTFYPKYFWSLAGFVVLLTGASTGVFILGRQPHDASIWIVLPIIFGVAVLVLSLGVWLLYKSNLDVYYQLKDEAQQYPLEILTAAKAYHLRAWKVEGIIAMYAGLNNTDESGF